MKRTFNQRVKDLAAIIIDADLPKRLQAENDYLRRCQKYETAPRWIRDEKTNKLFERQCDGSYRAAYRLIPLAL